MLQLSKLNILEYSEDMVINLADINTKMLEDRYILAFRQYTRAIISYSHFVKIYSESFHKYLGHEDKRLEYVRQYESIGLDALEYFEKCLSSWPSQGASSNTARN